MPVGPEFQDPPAPAPEINQAPYFVAPQGGFSAYPFYEQTVTLSGMKEFEAIVGDANLGDTLSARWVANYPPFSGASTLLTTLKSGERSTDPTWPFKFTVDCSMFMQGGADHNLVVIVSDRGFSDPGVDPAGHSQEPFNWTEAPQNPSSGQSQLIATMIGWRITGCQ